MADKQPLNATFFAFPNRGQSGVLLALSIAFLVVVIALIAAFAALFWGSIAPITTWYGQVITASMNNDTAAIEQAGFPTQFFTVVGALLLWMFPIYILCAAFEAGCLRWLIHGEREGFMGLSLGAPTWRVWSCYWIWLLLNMAFSIVMSIVMAMVIGAVAVGSGGDPTATLTVMPVIYVVQYVLMAYFATRFAPASAATIARRKFAFFDAWTVTKGRFWALFGSFVLIYLFYAIASLVLAGVYFVAVLGPAAPDFAGAMNDPAQLQQLLTETVQAYLRSLSNPQSWIVFGVLQVIGVVIVALMYIAMYGVNARAAMVAIEEGKITPAES